MVTEKDYWEGNMTQEEFEENLPKYGYEYTPLSPKGDSIPKQVEYKEKVKQTSPDENPKGCLLYTSPSPRD